MKTIRICSLFSGIGGFEVGAKSINGEVVFASEIDKFAQKSYLANFPNNNLHGDITKIKSEDIPDFDLLVAGFPCQAFSAMGLQKGFEDTRGTLFFEVARILKDKKPKFFLLENVKNLVTHDNGRTFSTIIKILEDMGYFVSYKVLNTEKFGMPQNRERIYIVGSLKNKFDFFTVNYSSKQIFLEDILEENINQKYLLNIDISNIKFTEQTQKEHKLLKLFDIPKSMLKDLNYHRRVLSPLGIAPTLITTKPPKIFIDGKIRKLTPLECFRIQGYSDDFYLNISNVVSETQQYKQIGNSVCPIVICSILKQLID